MKSPIISVVFVPSRPYFLRSWRNLNFCGQERNYVIEHIQLFRERLSEKVHARIRKVIEGGFEFTVLQRNLKDGTRGHRHIFVSAKEKEQLKIRQLQCQEQRIDHIPYYFSGLLHAHFSENHSRNGGISCHRMS